MGIIWHWHDIWVVLIEVFWELRSWQGTLQISPSAALAVLYFQGISEHFDFSQEKKKWGGGGRRPQMSLETLVLFGWKQVLYCCSWHGSSFEGWETWFGHVQPSSSAPWRLLLRWVGQTPQPHIGRGTSLSWRGDLIICGNWGTRHIDAPPKCTQKNSHLCRLWRRLVQEQQEHSTKHLLVAAMVNWRTKLKTNGTLRGVRPVSSWAASVRKVALICEVGKNALYRDFRLYVGGKSGISLGGRMLVLVCFIIIWNNLNMKTFTFATTGIIFP